MPGHDSTTIDSDANDNEVDRIIAAYLQQVDDGLKPDRQAILKEHTQFDTELREFFDDLERFIAPPNTASTSSADEPATAPDAKLPKLRYFGEYELIREIARGGMGVVYEARQKSLKRTVAVKMILGGVLASDEDVQRFRTEAQAAAGLQHRNIVSIHEVGVCQDQHYFSMDLVNGPNLADMLKDGALHHDKAVKYVLKLAQAVQYAHARGTLHRDLKPSNILIDESNEPQITDFGLAKLILDDSGLTSTGARLGTPSYMSPEQAAGESDNVGPAGDIYSLGSILYELLTGRPPFRGTSVIQTLNMVVNQVPPPIRSLNPGIPRDLTTICLKCLQKRPTDRYASAEDLANDLGKFISGHPVSARPIGPIERSRRWLSAQRKSIPALTVLMTIVCVCLFAWQKYSVYKDDLKPKISFVTSGGPLVTEVRNNLDRQLVPDFTTPTASPVPLEAGDLSVQVSMPHHMSEEFQLYTGEQRPAYIQVDVEDRSVFPPLSVSTTPYIATLNDHADIFVADKTGIERLDGTTSKPIWKVDLTTNVVLEDANAKWNHWIENPADLRNRHALLQSPPDLNNDGTGDLVWLSGHSRGTRNKPPIGLIAQSGVDGQILWVHRLSVPPSEESEPRDLRIGKQESFGLRIVGQPCVEFINDDAVPDLIVTSTGEVRQVEAISGSDGKVLWTYQIEAKQYESPFRWTPDAADCEFESKCLSSLCVKIEEKPRVVVSTGRQLVCLDLRNGNEISVLYAKNWPIDDMTLGNLNADDSSDILIRHKAEKGNFTIKAISVKDSSIIWQCDEGQRASNSSPLFVENVDQSDSAKIIFACTESTHGHRSGKSYGICRMLTGDTGKVVWASEKIFIRNWSSSLQIQPVSDLDGDGNRDVLTVHTMRPDKGMQHRSETLQTYDGIMIVTHALSGRNGQTLWKDSQFVRGGSDSMVPRRIQEWTDGISGRPQIILSMRSASISGLNRPIALVLDIGENDDSENPRHPVRIIPEADDARLADFNGDGHLDIYWHDQSESDWRDRPTTLHTIAGGSPVMWRRLGYWSPYADFNGDGITDLLDSSHGSSSLNLTAVSGLNGRILWDNQDYSTTAMPLQLPGGDMNNDGCDDIIRFSLSRDTIIREAISGKTGDALWRLEDEFGPESPFGPASNRTSRIDFKSATAIDIDMDGSSEVVLLTRGDGAPEVIVLDADSGEVMWHSPKTSRNSGRIWTISQSRIHADGTPSLMILRQEEKKTASRRAGRSNNTELTLETLQGTTGKRIEKHVLAKHESTLIDASGAPWQTWLDRPYLRTPFNSGPVTVQLAAESLLFFVNRQGLIASDRNGNQRYSLSIPDRLVMNGARSAHLSALDIDSDGLDELIAITWISNPNAQPPTTLQQTIVSVKLQEGDGGLTPKILWEWKMPAAFGLVLETDLTDLEKANITVCSGNTVFNIDALTGTTRWTCDGPAWWTNDRNGLPFNQSYDMTYEFCRPIVLQQSKDDRPARILFHRYSDTRTLYAVDCRLSVPAK